MRWFKHMVGSSQDEKLMLVKDEFGMEGYGVYWTILEHIGAQINADNQQTFLELSVKSWRKITDFSPKKLQKFLVFCSEISLFSVVFLEEKIRVDCPKLLKYKDEYTRKSGETPDSKRTPNPQKSGATPEEETDTDIYNVGEFPDGGKPPPKKPKKYSDDDYRFAEKMADLVQQVAPAQKPPNLPKWADTIRLMRERDGRSLENISKVFSWANKHNFWAANILSPGKLREQYGTLDAQMRRPGNGRQVSGEFVA